MSMELRIDRIRCDGHGACAELLPELIALDDWGYPILADGPVPDDLLSLARRAVDVCPVLAVRLQRSQGGPYAARKNTLAPHTGVRSLGG